MTSHMTGRFWPDPACRQDLDEGLLMIQADAQILPREDFLEFTLSFANSVDHMADLQTIAFS